MEKFNLQKYITEGRINEEYYEITEPMVKWLDGHDLSQEEAKDFEYLSNILDNYAEEVGIEFTEEEGEDLGKQYYQLKYGNENPNEWEDEADDYFDYDEDGDINY